MKKSSNILIVSKVPVRFDFGGGPTDVKPFPEESEGIVVNASLSLLVTAKLSVSDGSEGITIISEDYATTENFTTIDDMDLSGPLSLVKATVKNIGPQFSFKLETRSDVPPGSGLGSSTALSIAIIKAFKYYEDGAYFNVDQIINKSLEIENSISGQSAGGQDQYAALIGKCNIFDFHKTYVGTTPVIIEKSLKRYINENSILCFSGSSHNSSTILKQVMKNFSRGDVSTSTILYNIKKLALTTASALESGDLKTFIKCINSTYSNQQMLHESISTTSIERIVEVGRNGGAIAAKIAGAGGGGFVFLLCNENKKKLVANKLIDEGFAIYPFSFLETLPEVTKSISG